MGFFKIKLTKCYITPFSIEAWNFIKKETLAQVFPCEFCEVSKNTFGRLLLHEVMTWL